jgi:serine/threonine protein kinase
LTNIHAVAFFDNNPSATAITPVALRSPELILGLKLGPAVDVWSFGCLMFQLLTDSSLFQVEPLEGDTFDEEANDEHLIQISEILSPLPEDLFKLWRRGREYFDANGHRIELGGTDDDEGVPLADVPRCETLGMLLNKRKSYEMNAHQEKELASLMCWILQADVKRRPSIAQILQQPWFQS